MCPALAPFTASRSLFPKTIYPRLAEIVQQMGSSSLMALPAEADFDTPIAAEIERYMSTDSSSARDRPNCSTWLGTWPAAPSAATGAVRAVLRRRPGA